MAVTTGFSWIFNNVVPSFFVNNGYTALSQSEVAVASNPGQTQYLVIWTDPNFSLSVEVRIIGSNGVPIDDEFTVNSTTAGSQSDSSPAGRLNGNFVVTFTDDSTGTEHRRARI